MEGSRQWEGEQRWVLTWELLFNQWLQWEHDLRYLTDKEYSRDILSIRGQMFVCGFVLPIKGERVCLLFRISLCMKLSNFQYSTNKPHAWPWWSSNQNNYSEILEKKYHQCPLVSQLKEKEHTIRFRITKSSSTIFWISLSSAKVFFMARSASQQKTVNKRLHDMHSAIQLYVNCRAGCMTSCY